MRTVFAWSYRALTDDTARLFRLLGLHPGPDFSIAAVAALVGRSAGQVRRILDTLVGAHLLEQIAPDRYQFHDLLRAYAADQAMNHEPEEDRREALQRLLLWYLYTTAEAVAHLLPVDQRIKLDSPEPGIAPLSFSSYSDALWWYGVERANLVAVARAAADLGLYRIAWQIPVVLRGVYAARNEFDDWITTGRIALEAAHRLGNLVGQAEALESLGKAAFRTRRLDQAEEYHRASLALRVENGDRFGAAVSINALGLLGLRHRRLNDALSYFEQSMTIIREIGNRRWVGLLLGNIGEVRYELAQLTQAAESLEAALAVDREVGDQGLVGNTLFFLSMTQREMGRTAEALSSIQNALRIALDHDNPAWEAHWLVEFARVQRVLGNPAEALTSYQRAANIQRRLGDRSREAMALDGTGEAYRELDRVAEAAEFHRQAAKTHRELGDQWQLAISLDNHATALARTGALDAIRPLWDEALRSLEGFDDPRATALRRRIIQMRAE